MRQTLKFLFVWVHICAYPLLLSTLLANTQWFFFFPIFFFSFFYLIFEIHKTKKKAHLAGLVSSVKAGLIDESSLFFFFFFLSFFSQYFLHLFFKMG